jgi:hypothetical protein
MLPANAAHEPTAETSGDCRRQPELNPAGASRVSGLIQNCSGQILAKKKT